jgi:hypothetical protein
LSIAEYDEMTPYELSVHADIYAEKAEQEREDKITLVWLGARLQRTEPFPSLNELLGKSDEEMSDEEMLEQVKKLNALFGGNVKTSDGKEAK